MRIEGYAEADLYAAVFTAATHAGFLVRLAHVQQIDPDDPMMGPWPHVVVQLERSPWWWLWGRWHERRARALEQQLTAMLPPLRVQVAIV